MGQNSSEQKKMFNDPDFAKRYKLGELLTGQYAQDLLNQMGLPSQTSPVHFLDLACGTGIVSKLAVETLSRVRSTEKLSSEDKFTCADLAPAMMDVLRARISGENWAIDSSQIEILEANMTDTKLPSDEYTHLACNFGPTLAPSPEKTLAESYRMLKSGGIAGWTSWTQVGWFPDMQRALVDIREDAAGKVKNGSANKQDRKLAEIPAIIKFEDMVAKLTGVDLQKTPRNRWDEAGFFKAQVEEVGFKDVKIEIVKKDFSMDIEDVAHMTRPIVGLVRMFWSEEEKKNIEGVDFDAVIGKWWEKRFQQADVKDGKIEWKDFVALVITAKKS